MTLPMDERSRPCWMSGLVIKWTRHWVTSPGLGMMCSACGRYVRAGHMAMRYGWQDGAGQMSGHECVECDEQTRRVGRADERVDNELAERACSAMMALP
jgi:hypothetical protein